MSSGLGPAMICQTQGGQLAEREWQENLISCRYSSRAAINWKLVFRGCEILNILDQLWIQCGLGPHIDRSWAP